MGGSEQLCGVAQLLGLLVCGVREFRILILFGNVGKHFVSEGGREANADVVLKRRDRLPAMFARAASGRKANRVMKRAG